MQKPVILLKRNKEETYQEAVKRALSQLELKDFIKSSDRVLIDLNLLLNEDYMRGNITDPRTCEGVVTYLITELGVLPQNIFVGDGGYPMETSGAIKRLKLPEMAEKYGFNVIDLNKDQQIKDIKPQNPLSLKKVNICKTAMDVEVIISVPSLKTHSMAVTTLSIKNLMGCITPKGGMHSSLHKRLADLFSIFHPRVKLAIIDGFIGSDGYEEGGSPIEMDLVIAGTDPVAVDTVGSAIIGYGIDECRYLKYCDEKGLGECDLTKIKIIGESIDSVKQKFDR